MEKTTEDRLAEIALSLARAQRQAVRARRVRDDLGGDPTNVLRVVRQTAAGAVKAVQEELEALAKGRTSV